MSSADDLRESPPKRRKTSPSSHALVDSPPRSTSPPRTHSAPKHNQSLPSNTRTRTRPLIAGFDDEEEDEDDDDDGPEGRSRTLSQGGGSGQDGHDEHGDEDEEQCAVCLSPIENKTVVYPCHHGQFCWGCIRAWTDQSRKCPLCLGPIEHLIHNIRSSKDYQNHYLLPLSALQSSAPSDQFLPPRGNRRPQVNVPLPRHALYGRNRHSSAARLNNGEDESTWRERAEERALERRKYIYREGLYAKHVASNRYTGFKPFNPQTFTTNPDMKARVIKFVRREIQVFPTVDVNFLTTYLVSIASQLDLRSSAAIRLISDFLSEQDAQHLVHEITTFARSPFTSLEGYDRFVQYGRPEREMPKARENEALVLPPDDEVAEELPRFAQHIQSTKGKEREGEGERPRPLPPMARLPPRPSEEVRRASQGQSQDELFRQHRGDQGYPAGGPSRRRSSPGRYRSPSPAPPPRPREPSWRDRDERYSGSYYGSSASRRDLARGGGRRYSGGGGGGYGYRDDRDRGRDGRGRYDEPRKRGRRGYSRSPSPPPRRRSLSRGRSRSRSRPPRSRSRSPRPRSRSRSPSPARSYRSRRSPSPRHHSRFPSRRSSRADNPPRGRSRSLTPLRRTASLTPPPLAGADEQEAPYDPELEDAVSLGGPPSPGPPSRPSSSVAPDRPASSSSSHPLPSRPSSAASASSIPTGPRNPSLRPLPPHLQPHSQQQQQNQASKPTLSIFGAARKQILGNGRVVTIRADGGGASLSIAGAAGAGGGGGGRGGVPTGPRAGRGRGGAAMAPGAGAGRGKGPERVLRPVQGGREQEPYDATPAVKTPARSMSLLSRLGAFAPSPAPSSATSGEGATEAAAPAAGDSLRAKLQARLMAEYRAALAAKAAPSVSSSAAAPGSSSESGLRAMLQARLQAEKALSPSDRPQSAPPTFSQDTRDLLLARLEEERLLALVQASRAEAGWRRESYGYDEGAVADGWEEEDDPDFDVVIHREEEDEGGFVPSPPGVPSRPPSAATKPLSASAPSFTPSSASSSSSPALPPPAAPASALPGGTESALRAALLAKRQAAVEDELKKRTGELKEKMVRQKLERLRREREAKALEVAAGTA
ncbi:hypothetical protein JCM8097_002009 [Rhodosporidiobolus ruineniae]